MAKYSKGANGAFSGKVGSVIGSNWRSIDYMKGLSKKAVNPVQTGSWRNEANLPLHRFT